MRTSSDWAQEYVVIDASAIASELSAEPARADLVDSIPFGSDYLADMAEVGRDRITHYVHFGDGAFDSPYDGACVEGVYVTFRFRFQFDERPDLVTFVLVVSDNSPDAGYGGPTLRNALRTHNLGFVFDEPSSLLTEIEDRKSLEDGEDDFDRLWYPYSTAPAIAALHAVHRYYAPGTHRIFQIHESEDASTVALFERAVTFNDTRNAIHKTNGRFPVCFIGGTPKPAQNRTPGFAGPIRGQGQRYAELSEEDFNFFVDEGKCMRTVGGHMLAARRAMEIAVELQRTGTCDVLEEAHANLAGAAFLSGDLEVAIATSRWFTERYADYSNIEARFRPIVASALVLDGKFELAAEILEYPSDGVADGAYEVATEFLEDTLKLATPAERMAFLLDSWRAEYLVSDGEGLELNPDEELGLAPY
jgi:hypothetical protein